MSSKKITIQDIANTAKVSKSTVSRVLNDTTPVNDKKRAAVEKAMKQLNFQPNLFARGLAGGNSMTIGILTQNIGSPFYDAVNQGVIHQLVGTNYSPIFVDGQWQDDVGQTGLRVLLGRQVDGVIVIGGNMAPQSLIELKDRTRLIVVARSIEGLEENCLYIDNFQAAYDATQYLIESGHTKIAHIMGIPTHQDAIRRHAGYTQALKDANIELDEELVFEGSFDGRSGLIAIESLLMNRKSFTAVFCGSDSMALGARLALYRRGIRVPEDMSLIGFDDQPGAELMTPPLTTVRQPATEMGQAAADAMLKMIEKKEYELPTFQANLVFRESVARRL